MRPSPETSAYHAANPLEEQVLDRLAAAEDVTCVVIPRTEAQAERIRARRMASLIVPDRAIDAQSLIAFADLVVSAGGTMNREAVALGTPAYTIFSGRMGAIDEQLIAQGRLIPLRDPGELLLAKREAGPGPGAPQDPNLLVDAILGAVGTGR
jgi:predicted glycosyltransferase